MIMFGRTSRFSEKVGFFVVFCCCFSGGVLFCLFLWIVFRQKKLGEGGVCVLSLLYFIIILINVFSNPKH